MMVAGFVLHYVSRGHQIQSGVALEKETGGIGFLFLVQHSYDAGYGQQQRLDQIILLTMAPGARPEPEEDHRLRDALAQKPQRCRSIGIVPVPRSAPDFATPDNTRFERRGFDLACPEADSRRLACNFDSAIHDMPRWRLPPFMGSMRILCESCPAGKFRGDARRANSGSGIPLSPPPPHDSFQPFVFQADYMQNRLNVQWLLAVATVVCIASGAYWYADLLRSAFIRNPIPRSAESIARGRQLFAKNCAVCHGAEGRGDGAAASALPQRPDDLGTIAPPPVFPDGVVAYRIINGVKMMPGFKSTLSDNEIWDLLNFIRSLAKQ